MMQPMDQVRQDEFNRLLAKKSSFQAWKCVSLGYALLALVLLSSKLHEVTTDLRLLQSIDQILAGSSPANANATGAAGGPTGNLSSPAGWPPMALELMLVASQQANESAPGGSSSSDVASRAGDQQANSSVDGQPGGQSASSLLMSHMHNSIGRELSGNQLLRQEVESFLGEFRSAKSTLALSSLLVSVYIVSWILMTLAINDTRISNDVSLRNILLLSVFGAIDMAASVAFVMVRLIMFNVKSNHFLAQMLASSSLGATPTRLSADQLTSFTALRLIAMRSCSAYVDIYVSVLVALLTLLRLYAILRALAYYRKLRSFNDTSRQLDAILFNELHQPPPVDPQQRQQQQQKGWPTSHQPISSPTNYSGRPNQPRLNETLLLSPRLGPLNPLNPADFRLHPSHYQVSSEPAGADQHQEQLNRLSGSLRASYNQLNEIQQQLQATSNKSHSSSKLINLNEQQQLVAAAAVGGGGGSGGGGGRNEARDRARQQQQQHLLVQANGTQMSKTTNRQSPPPLLVLNNHLDGHQQHQQQQQQTKPMTFADLTATKTRRHKHNKLKLNQRQQPNSSAPNVLLVNGRAHRLIAAPAGHHDPLAGFESEPVEVARQRQVGPGDLFVATSEQNLQTAADNNNNNQSQNHFTLLSASQLNKLSRKLLAAGSSATLGAAKAPNPLAPSKYRLVGRYKPIAEAPATKRRQRLPSALLAGQINPPTVDLLSGAGREPETSTSAVSSSDLSTSSAGHESDGPPVQLVSGRRQERAHSNSLAATLASLRQMDELVGVEATRHEANTRLAYLSHQPNQAAGQQTAANSNPTGRELLLEKYHKKCQPDAANCQPGQPNDGGSKLSSSSSLSPSSSSSSSSSSFDYEDKQAQTFRFHSPTDSAHHSASLGSPDARPLAQQVPGSRLLPANSVSASDTQAKAPTKAASAGLIVSSRPTQDDGHRWKARES